MSDSKLIITIDGPAGSGKSTTARCVAKQLGYVYLDSGALYRAVTLAALRQKIDFADDEAIAEIAARSDIRLVSQNDGMHVYLNGEDVTTAIRMPHVSQAIGPVSANRRVREILVEHQRRIGAGGGVVAEGRDMGTVVFPQADLKYYLSATIEERARRRQQDLASLGISVKLERIKEEIYKRDEDDRLREFGPLRRPPEAIDIDTTQLTIAQQVARIVQDAVRLGARLQQPLISVDPDAGFCPGVRRAIKLVEAELSRGDLIALGSVIHNERELNRLHNLGLQTVAQESLNDAVLTTLRGKKMLIRTHGISPDLRQQLQQNNVEIVDATCRIVNHVQQTVAEYHQKGYQIAIIGKDGHAEVIGLLGHCQQQGIVVENEADLERLDEARKTLVVAQTTIGKDKFNRLAELIKGRLSQVTVLDTTCGFIRRRYQQVAEFARSVGAVLFVSGKRSSNAQVLFEICRQHNPKSYKIEATSEINLQWFAGVKSIGITGAASTPLWQLDEVKAFLMCNLDERAKEAT